MTHILATLAPQMHAAVHYDQNDTIATDRSDPGTSLTVTDSYRALKIATWRPHVRSESYPQDRPHEGIAILQSSQDPIRTLYALGYSARPDLMDPGHRGKPVGPRLSGE